MAIDFFEQQDVAQRKTGWLVFLFIVAIISIVVTLYVIIVFALGLVSNPENEMDISIYSPSGLWDPLLFLVISTITTGVIALGSLYKMAQLSSGGETVALMLGGRLLDAQSRSLPEQRLLNVVEEMALASGVPVPPVYVLENEKSINAFAAGHQPGDAVIGVSRGCLNHLTRDELQGVMAHEFSHILNGDMRLNIRLMGITHGILVIAILGYYIIRASAYSGGSSNRRGGGGGLIFLGLGLVVVGYMGVLFGKIIRSGISRQREYLADAAAVQFTRYPDGIAGALKKIGGLRFGSRIRDIHAEEVSHMFFGSAFGEMNLDFMATHPPLKKRILRLDPNFDGKFIKIEIPKEDLHHLLGEAFGSKSTEKARQEINKIKAGKARKALGSIFPTSVTGPGGAVRSIPLDPTQTVQRIGIPGLEQILLAAVLIEGIPEPVRDAVHEPYGARAVIYALLLDHHDEAVRSKQLKELQSRAEELSYRETLRIVSRIDKLPEEARAPLIDMSLPALKKLSPDQYTTFRENVDALVKADGKIELFEYVIRTTLVRNLDIHFGRAKPARSRYYALNPLRDSLAVVLSMLARTGHDSKKETERAFSLALREVGWTQAILPKEACTLPTFDKAIKKLAQSSPKIKKRILTACAACIGADGKVTVHEGELLRVIASTLNCPMPSVRATPSDTKSTTT